MPLIDLPPGAQLDPTPGLADLPAGIVLDAKSPQQLRGEFDAMPWYSRLGTAADDIARLMANGGTFGFADKIAGAVGGDGTGAERAKTEEARQRAGSAGMVAEYGTPALTATGLARGGITAASLVPRALTGIPGFLARTGASAADAAAYGGLSAAGHDQNIGEGAATGAAIGSIAGPLVEGAGALINRFLPKGQLPAPLPKDVTKAAGNAAYARADQAGVTIRPEGLQRLSGDLNKSLYELGYHPALQPKVGVALGELDNMLTPSADGVPTNVTLKGLDILRRMAGAAKSDADPSTRLMGGTVVGKIDDFLDSLKDNEVLSGNRTEGVTALREARALWQTMRKTETIDDAIEAATNNTGVAGSGGNIDNNIRQQFRTILNSKTRRLGWTNDELDAMRTIARGTSAQNLARLVGKLSPSGNGLSLILHVLGAASGTGAATIPAAVVGTGAKMVGDRATQANVNNLGALVGLGGDASRLAAAKQAAERLPAPERDALARLISALGVTAVTP